MYHMSSYTTRIYIWYLCLHIVVINYSYTISRSVCLLAVASLSFTVCAGPGPCGQAILWSLDGQRWTAEADGEYDTKER